jgi:hypothetical protein
MNYNGQGAVRARAWSHPPPQLIVSPGFARSVRRGRLRASAGGKLHEGHGWTAALSVLSPDPERFFEFVRAKFVFVAQRSPERRRHRRTKE